jgi:retron-type reverse transcriptase
MKLEQSHIDQIRSSFKKMQTREDFLQLMNEAKPLVYGEKAVPFEMKQLTWYSNPKLSKKRYTEFKIKKKSGADRIIHAPVKGLKAIQKTLSFILQCVFEPHHAAMGFVRDKSIVDNARLHSGSKYVYNIDLKDFFPSIDQARVWKCLQLPFNLNIKNNQELQKSDENATYKVLQLVEHTVWPKETNNILSFIYDGLYLNSGKRMLKLKAGGYIVYKVEVNSVNKQKGSINIYEEKSQYDQIKELARESSEKENSDFRRTLFSMLLYLVSTHSIKSSIKNSRSNLPNIIAALCCTEIYVERKSELSEWGLVKRNVLPQGAPTSPVITNIVCQRLDYLLSGVAKRFGLKYSRYADDITFSSMHNVYDPESNFLKELHRIIAEQGFHIKESKTRLQKDGHRQEVTGLLVNEKVNVQHRYIKQLRMWLYYWERYGYERAYDFFLRQYMADKGNLVKGKPDMANVIGGKLDYLKMVKGPDNELYLKLKVRFDKLCVLVSPLSSILDVWENEGIEKAMEVYSEKNI